MPPEGVFTMSSNPPIVRTAQLTPIPEHTPRFVATAAPFYPSSPSKLNMAAVPTPPLGLLPPGLPLTYYTDFPDKMPALFSTCMQSQPKRALVAPYPPVMVRSDLGFDVKRKCDYLCQWFPEEVRKITKVYLAIRNQDPWYRLYNYFDAVDLWVETPAFCFLVINRLIEIFQGSIEQQHQYLADFAKTWVDANSRRLVNVMDHVDVITLFSPEECQAEDFHMLTEEEIFVLKFQLNKARDALLHQHRTTAMQNMGGYPQASYYEQGPPQTYNNFMDQQRNLQQGRVDNVPRDGRHRRWSNDTNQGSFRYAAVAPNDQKHEPVYIRTHTGHRNASADMAISRTAQNVPTRPRTFSNTSRTGFSCDARNYMPSRRTASEETTNRPAFHTYSNGEKSHKSNQHFRAPSGSSIGYRSRSGTITPKTISGEDIVIEGYNYKVFLNGSVTIYYNSTGTTDSARTAFVNCVPESMFMDHTLKAMMSDCGVVETISYLRNPGGTAFVLFHHEESVTNAIRKWNEYEIVPGSGQKLMVKFPEKRGRGFSMSSMGRDNRYSASSYPRGHSRNFSANMRGEPYRPSVPEVLEDRRMNIPHFTHTPLHDIHNLSPTNQSPLRKAIGNVFHNSQPSFGPQKENSPINSPSRSENTTPKSKKTVHHGTGHHRRKSSMHDSRQHTPTGTPKKSRSGGNGMEQRMSYEFKDIGIGNEHFLDDRMQVATPESLTHVAPSTAAALEEHEHEHEISSTPGEAVGHANQLHSNPRQEHAKFQSSEAGPKKGKNKSKKKGKPNDIKTMTASFTTDSSLETIVSPVSNENGSFRGNPSTVTSFSTSSSRQASVASTKSRKPRDHIETVDNPVDVKAEIHKDGEKKNAEATLEQAPHTAPKSKNKTRKVSKPAHIVEESVSQTAKPSHSKKESTSSVASNPSLRKTDAAAKEADQSIPLPFPQPSLCVEPEKKVIDQAGPIGSSSVVAEAKENAGNRPAPITIPTPTTAVKGTPISASIGTPKRDVQTLKLLPETVKSPKQLDEQEWPVLNPVKSPVSAIADGKPPTPLRAPLMGLLSKTLSENSPEGQKPPKSIYPPVAVPRSFQRSTSLHSQPPPILRVPQPDDLGTELWPFVRKFEAR